MDIITHTNGQYNIDTIVIDDGDIYFRGDQTGYALGYKNPAKAIKDNCILDGIKKILTSTAGGNQYITYIDEANLYLLTARSNLPQAKEFKRWVFKKVLPSIRRTGMYAVDEIIENPELAIKALTALMEERNKTKMLEKEKEVFVKRIEIDAPKVEFHDIVTGSVGLVHMSKIAKILNVKGMGRNNLFKFLRNKGVLMNNNDPYQAFIDREYFELVETHFTVRDEERVGFTTKVTGKGQVYILKILKEAGYDSRNTAQ